MDSNTADVVTRLRLIRVTEIHGVTVRSVLFWAACLVSQFPEIISQGHAENYPSKPIRWIMPFPAGGGADIVARLVGQKLSEAWGQPVIIDNRTGATGIIGVVLVGTSAPDGYTILMGNAATHGINPSLAKALPYDPIKDFVPITLIATPPEVLVVNPSFKANSVADLIAIAKSQPGSLTYGSAGKGTAPHLGAARFALMAGIDVVHVPYRGGPPAILDLMGGRITMYFYNIVSAAPLVRSGKLKALAVTTKQRSGATPTVPTIAESGLPDYEESNWFGALAPAKTPRALINILHKGMVAALNAPDVKESLLRDGALVIASTPEEFGGFIKREISKYAALTKAAGIAPE